MFKNMKIKEQKKQKSIILFLLFLVIFSSIFFLFKKKKNTEKMFIVSRRTISEELRFAGTVDALRRSEIGFVIGGRVKSIYAKEGDFVKKGQIIAELDQNSVRSNLVDARSQYLFTNVETNKETEKLIKSYEDLKKEQDKLVENARREYLSGDLQAYIEGEDSIQNIPAPIISGSYTGTEEGEYVIKVYRSKSNSKYSFVYSGLESGTSTAEIYHPGPLGTKGLYIQFIPGVNYKDTTFHIPIPNTRSSTYVSRRNAYLKALAVREKVLNDAKNTILKQTGKDIQTKISLNEAKKKNAAAKIYAQKIRLMDGKIIAPFDGYIVKNDLEIGEIVKGLVPYITIVSSKKRKFVMNIPELYVSKISVGDKALIILDAYPDIEFSGLITNIDEISTLVEGSPVYQSDILFDSEDERIKIGMNGYAKILSWKRKNVLAVPKYLLKEENEKYYVFLKEKEDFVKKEVKIGKIGNDGFVEIISGLKEGDLILKKS